MYNPKVEKTQNFAQNPVKLRGLENIDKTDEIHSVSSANNQEPKQKTDLPPAEVIQKKETYPTLREHKHRLPRGFRIDVDLIEYIERHEKYRAALPDPRTFTEKLNAWIRTKMEEEDPILRIAEEEVVRLRTMHNLKKPVDIPEMSA